MRCEAGGGAPYGHPTGQGLHAEVALTPKPVRRVASQQTHPPPLADMMPRSADGDPAVRSRAASRVAAPCARSGQTRLI
jgi:hypothetical protein